MRKERPGAESVKSHYYIAFTSPLPADLAKLSILSIGHFGYGPGATCSRLQGHRVEHLIYTLRGAANGTIAGERSRCVPGSLWLMPKDRPYAYGTDATAGIWEGYWIEYDGAWARPLWKTTGMEGVSHLPGCFEARPIVEAIHECARTNTRASLHEAAALLWRLFAVAEAHLAGARVQGNSTLAAIARAQAYIREHLAERIPLQKLAQVAGLSPFHFTRVFHERTGFAPIAYVRAVRMSRAQELLQQGEWSVKQVAYAVGYPVQQHFSAIFKQCTGLAPRAFMRMHKR